MNPDNEAVLQLLRQHEEDILTQWLQEAGSASTRMSDAARKSMRAEAEPAS